MADSEPKLIRLCETMAVPSGTVRRVTVDGMPPLAVYNLDNEFFVSDDTCTHGQASLSEGVVDGNLIECPLHAGCFSIRTGEPLAFPAAVPIRTYPARVIGDEIFAEIGKGDSP
jgi:nitrite reductase/ring-hydroxylating ferredoxin subunit